MGFSEHKLIDSACVFLLPKKKTERGYSDAEPEAETVCR